MDLMLIIRRVINAPSADKVVYRDVCKAGQDGIKARLADLQQHVDRRFDDLKQFIQKNGRT